MQIKGFQEERYEGNVRRIDEKTAIAIKSMWEKRQRNITEGTVIINNRIANARVQKERGRAR